ncbi:MAG: hypothetical protein QOD99_2414 [Chthoniobacter sp.]|nr:hypothetical protein [Chthoniobacter sp.]
MTPRAWLFICLGALTVLRLALIGLNELSPDEAYYCLWAQHPALSYYSKGPAVAFTIKAGMALFGANEFGVRFFAPWLALGTSLILFFFARRLYGETVAIWTVLAMNCIPIFNVGGVVMTIDPLSIFFWAAALFTFWLALEKSPAFTWWWALTGLLIGLGFLSKYTNAMQLLSVVLVLALTQKYRREFARIGFYSMLATFAICTLPPIIWNQQNEWITLAHLRARGGLNSAFAVHPGELFSFLGAHLGVYSPLLFASLMMALGWAWRPAKTKYKPRFLLLFALPLLVMYFILSLKQAGEANWTAPAFVSLGILATAIWHEAAQTSGWKARFAMSGMILGILMSWLIIRTDVLRDVRIPLSYALDPSSRLRGWKSGAEGIEKARLKFEQQTGKPAFLIANKYQTAATLSFYLPEKRVEGPGHPPVYTPESQSMDTEFSFWPRYEEFVAVPDVQRPDAYYTEEQGVNPFIGRNALYITDRAEERPPTSIKSGFERVEMIALLELNRRGLPLRELRVFACYNYHSLPL